MEIILHSMYVVAIKDSGIDWWTNLGPLQVSMIGFWNLIIVWLKVSTHLVVVELAHAHSRMTAWT